MNGRLLLLFLPLLTLLSPWTAALAAKERYEIGGPLFGVPLPPYPTQHGEPPGYPGCLPDPERPGSLLYSPQGQFPEPLLYEGSVEHWRTYWQKYLPVRSMFDRQSLIRNWLARDLPRVTAESYAEPVYHQPRHGEAKATGRFHRPVPVVRCRPGTPVLRLNLGTLAPGMYAVRVIGAVETHQLQRHRKPLRLRLTVNDGLQGESSTYRLRLGYVDEFYSVAEFYFHAPTRRSYRAELVVDEDSQVDLLVHNVDLHDALAGVERRPIKSRSVLPAAKVTAATNPPPLDASQRLARDERLWNAYPPLNAMLGHLYGMGGDDGKSNWPNLGAGGKTPQEIEDEFGRWEFDRLPDGDTSVWLTNKKLGLSYTLADLKAHRPLPDPYPFKDNGTGVFTPAASPDANPQNWYPLANAVRDLHQNYRRSLELLVNQYRDKGDRLAGRDAALMLCRVAYDFPALDGANSMSAVIVMPGAYGRDLRCRQRETRYGLVSDTFTENYDKLFDLIQGNEELAASVRRFVPWIRSSRDVIELIDSHLVQPAARRFLRYHEYASNEPAMVLTPTIVLGERRVTDPWMEWLFTKTFIYPLPPSGLQDLLVTGNDRNGMGYIGSFFYAQGQEAASKAALLERYIATGGNPRYDLRDPKRFPKVHRACYWFLETRMAGLHFPRIGDVAGPDKPYGLWFENVLRMSRLGWRWTRDPRFAYVVKHFAARADENDEEWAALEQAAEGQRAPWLENRSRVLPAWFGVLETGIEHDDFRFRRAVMLRIGQGWGHQHHDTLDLQIYAHGYPMTIDGGQRPGYSKPGDGTTRVHNLVEVDGKSWLGHSWVTALTEAEGARYLAAEAVPPPSHPNVTFHRRQIALLDVDEGRGAKPLTPAQLRPETKLDPDVITPNSYVFDVVRVSGGRLHTYAFHGPIEDEFKVNLPALLTWDQMTETDREYLKPFPLTDRAFAGEAPPVVEATWRMSRTAVRGSEPSMAPGIWNEASPRKYTRLHLFAPAGARVLSGVLDCFQWKYSFANLFVQQRSEQETDAVFPALIEPFVGEPFLTGRSLVEIADNETDARRAVAIEVNTRNGRRDLCFADGRPDRTRRLRAARGEVRVAGEFAYLSEDADGLRQASLSGGTLLEAPGIRIQTAQGERTGRVVGADYPNRTLTIDRPWPAELLAGRVLEVGIPGHMTTYTVQQASPSKGGTALTVVGGADFYLSRVREVDATKGRVVCALSLPFLEGHPCPGLDKGWVASNETLTKFWRADYLGGSRDEGRFEFQFQGKVTLADFGRTRGMYLWEYGVGDNVRQSTFVHVRRLAAGRYEVSADTDCEVAVGGKRHQVTVAALAGGGGRVPLEP